MPTRYCMITYPNAEPLLAEMSERDGQDWINGHGAISVLTLYDIVIAPLVAMTPARVTALQKIGDLLNRYALNYGFLYGEEIATAEAVNVLVEILVEAAPR